MTDEQRQQIEELGLNEVNWEELTPKERAIIEALPSAIDHFIKNIYKELENFPVDEILKNTEKVVRGFYGLDPLPQEEKPVKEKGKKTIRPKDLLVPCDIVTEKAFSEQEELYSNELVKLEVSKEDSEKKVHTMVSLSVSFDELEENGIRLSGRYTLGNFDRLVYNAVISLYLAGNESMTYKMINSVMTGNYNGRLTQKQRDAIDNSLSKMMFTRISIDTTEEYKTYKYRLQLASRNYFLPLSMTREPLNGQEVDCIRVIDYPQALTYADVRNKFIRFPFELQASPVNKDQESLFLQDYLLTRISTMKRTSLSRNILYGTIYSYLKLETEFQNKASLKNKKAKIRDKVKKILDHFASQNFIKGYTENKEGNVFYSVSIILKNIPKELKS